ncbi:hypothetical protein [Pseudomonas sp.]|uniref:hypothetical protein n=1 Tax=Pseudomonas sp. TaxID=306 RepID=UPI0028A26A95|nr:hypothetical protein [Pseudomonas sp.]
MQLLGAAAAKYHCHCKSFCGVFRTRPVSKPDAKDFNVRWAPVKKLSNYQAVRPCKEQAERASGAEITKYFDYGEMLAPIISLVIAQALEKGAIAPFSTIELNLKVLASAQSARPSR